MTGRANQIGFSQRVRLEWLEQTANYALAGNNKANVNDALQELLKEKVSVGGQAVRGNREKIITILLKVWVTVPEELESLRLEGLNLMKPRYDTSKTDVPVTARCSAFAACGKATRDGKMLIAHVTMWPLTLAEQTNIMLDIVPTEGHRMLMQSYPGGIQSGTD